jgi:hypothetical protein
VNIRDVERDEPGRRPAHEVMAFKARNASPVSRTHRSQQIDSRPSAEGSNRSQDQSLQRPRHDPPPPQASSTAPSCVLMIVAPRFDTWPRHATAQRLVDAASCRRHVATGA